MDKKRLTAYAMLLAATVIWGVAPPVIKFTLADFSPIVFLTYRFFISILIILPLFVLVDDNVPKVKTKDWMYVALAGLLSSSVNLGLLFWGIDNTTALAGALIASTSPVIIVLAGVLFLKEKVTKQEKIGLLIALLGSLIITVSPSLNHTGGSVFGNLLIIVANFSWVAYLIICKKKLYSVFSPLFLTTSSFIIGFLSLFPFAIKEAGSISNLVYNVADAHMGAHLGVIYMAVFSGVIAYWIYQEGQKRIEISEATMFSYLGPLFAAPLSILWLNEKPSSLFLAGATIIAIGVIMAEYRKRKLKS